MKNIFEESTERTVEEKKKFIDRVEVGQVWRTVSPSSGVKIISIEEREGRKIIEGNYLDKDGNETGSTDLWDENGENIEGPSGANLDYVEPKT